MPMTLTDVVDEEVEGGVDCFLEGGVVRVV